VHRASFFVHRKYLLAPCLPANLGGGRERMKGEGFRVTQGFSPEQVSLSSLKFPVENFLSVEIRG